MDSRGRDYLARGTELPTATLDVAQVQGEGGQFGVYSPSSFVTIRQRLNMNAVRLPVDVALYNQRAEYRARIHEIVRRANQFELLVILAAGSGDVGEGAALDFWRRCAAEFRTNPNVFFAVGHDAGAAPVEALVAAIRGAGAAQPIVAAGFAEGETLPQGANLVYQATPRYAAIRTEADRRRQFALADRAPMLANDMDPQLDTPSEECAAFPADPGEASKLVESNLDYFDQHHISWTLSQFRRGRMLTDYRSFTWLKLDDGWTCGVSPAGSGIGMLLLAHLWNADPHGLLAVHPPQGGMAVARGAVVTAYGRVLAERQMDAPGVGPLPLALGNVSIRVTDSRGVARRAPLLFTAAGWGEITFLIPENSATGGAEVAVVRTDGSSTSTKVMIADVTPGLWTATNDGRGPVIAQVTQRFANGASKTFPAWHCTGAYECRAAPIPLASGVTTTVRLEGSGIRHAGPHAAIRVMVGDVAAPVLSYGPLDQRGRDRITVRLPDALQGVGETDLFLTVDGRLSNVARIHCGRME